MYFSGISDIVIYDEKVSTKVFIEFVQSFPSSCKKLDR